MPKTKVEVYDKNQLIYPYIESDHVTFSNGMKVNEMLDQSISMPTVIHEDLSFKVGVGDQDVSSAIVDSSVAEMTIKGKTYQNILPEPSTHVLTNNKEMFKVNEGLDPNVEIVDGVSKSAILKGQTLVNLAGKPKSVFCNNGIDMIFIYDKTSYVNRSLTVKPNTTYTIFNFNDKKISSLGLYSEDNRYITELTLNGNSVIKHTTSSDTFIMNFLCRNTEGWTEEELLNGSNIVLIEGDYTNANIPYFDGMQSVKMPVLTTTGKNLYNPKTAYVGSHANQDVYNKVNVKPNTTYTFYANGKNWFGCVLYDKNGNQTRVLSGSAHITKSTFTTTENEVEVLLSYYTGKEGVIIEDVDFTGVQLEIGAETTPFEPYKSNILHTPEEVVLRSLPNGVCDTLNLNTGEYVKRIGEITYTGKDTEGWRESVASYESDDIDSFYTYIHNPQSSVVSKHCHCNLFPVYYNLPSNPTFEYFHILNAGSSQIVIGIKRSKLSSQDSTGIKSWLQTNPLTVQYILETPIIKTVDLSSSGNWEKVVLNGSENWSITNNTHFYTKLSDELSPDALLPVLDNSSFVPSENTNSSVNAVWYGGNMGSKNGNIVFNVLDKTLEQFKQCLSQNPITVWYPVVTHKDSTQVKQPIFFKDGHIIQSSGADNSLIPTLDYQAKTSNSYVMDLMKTNTKYTMKAKSASGTFTIDGTSYGAGTNGTFTTPTSMTNKLLVMSNKTNEEVMILEGDVTDKTIPYFKGIKSAFEDESKIEVLSTGKNIFDGSTISGVSYWADNGTVNQNGGVGNCYISYTYVNVKSGQTLYPNHTQGSVQFMEYDSNKRFIRRYNLSARNKYTVPNGVSYLRFSFYNCGDNLPQIEFNNQSTSYEPYKQNVSKIPLLSPLRSLPNGVCDELIIDRMKNKATLIQRVGEIYATTSYMSASYFSASSSNNYRNEKSCAFLYNLKNTVLPFNRGETREGAIVCEGLPSYNGNTWNTSIYTCAISGVNSSYDFCFRFPNSETLITLNDSDDMVRKQFNRHLNNKNMKLLYELKTPIITEVDIEGFPYIYKDGHIFLNSEIAPTTEITYSINQCQQISASNEDIIRHEKELTYLQKLIAQYVQVDYESALLNLKV